MFSGELRTHFGAAVRAQRKRLGLSQEVLAERAGLHRTYIADVERGARNLSLASIEKIAKALELPIATLFCQALGDEFEPRSVVQILLVLNNGDEAESIVRTLTAGNLVNPVRVATTGTEALEIIFREIQPDQLEPLPLLILLDINLPGQIGGLELVRRLKSDKRSRSIPIVALTSSDGESDIAGIQRLGVDAYLPKPMDFTRFTRMAPLLQLCWGLLKSSAPADD